MLKFAGVFSFQTMFFTFFSKLLLTDICPDTQYRQPYIAVRDQFQSVALNRLCIRSNISTRS